MLACRQKLYLKRMAARAATLSASMVVVVKTHGKKFMISATWNAPKDAFDNPEGILFGGKGTDDLFLHITANYKFIGFDILPNYGIFDIFKNLDVSGTLAEYKQHLEKYCLNAK